MRFILNIRFLFLLLLTSLYAAADLGQIERLMAQRQFAQVETTIDSELKNNPADADNLLYLKAVAQFEQKKYDQTHATLKKLLADHPKSDWRYKGLFLQAQTFVEEKNFAEAEKIYGKQSQRLLTDERRLGLIGLIETTAKAHLEPSKPGEEPNYQEALSTYNKILALNLPEAEQARCMFEAASIAQKGKKWQKAKTLWNSYLDKYDPDWQWGNANQVTQLTAPRRHQARLELAKAHIESHNWGTARQQLLNLKEILPENDDDEVFTADVEWAFLQSFALPNPDPDLLHEAIANTRGFLKAHPTHPRCVQAAFLIGECYDRANRADLAVEAYAAFLKEEDFKLKRINEEITIEKDLTALEVHARLAPRAMYRTGRIQLRQGNFQAAVKTFESYVANYPQGPNWSDAHTGIIDAHYLDALDAVAQKEWRDARKKFAAFLKKHPLDKRRPAILLMEGITFVLEAKDLEDSKKAASLRQDAIAVWGRLIKKYPQTNESQLARVEAAILNDTFGDPEIALSYVPDNIVSRSASIMRQIVSSPVLELKTEKLATTQEKATATLTTRNLKEVTIKQYQLDLDAFFRKYHTIQHVERLNLKLIEPNEEWTMEPAPKFPRQRVSSSIAARLPPGPGAAILRCQSGILNSTILVIRSDITITAVTSGNELLIYAQHPKTTEPVANAKILASDGSKIFNQGETDASGILILSLEKALVHADSLRIFAQKNGHVAATSIVNERRSTHKLAPVGEIVFDKPVYAPGATVGAWGLRREVIDGRLSIPKDNYAILIKSNTNRVLLKQPAKFSSFGTFTAELNLPKDATLGTYSLSLQRIADDSNVMTRTFKVDHVKIPPVRITFTPDQEIYLRGDTITLHAEATYRWGQPVSNRKFSCTMPDGRTVHLTSDKKGQFDLVHHAVGSETALLTFTTTLTEEGITVSHAVPVDRQAFHISLNLPEDLRQNEATTLRIETQRPDGTGTKQQLAVEVLAQQSRAIPVAFHKYASRTWHELPPAERSLSTHKITTDDSGRAALPLTFIEAGDIIIRAIGSDRRSVRIEGTHTATVTALSDAPLLRIVNPPAATAPDSPMEITVESKEKIENALVILEADRIILHRITDLKRGKNKLILPVGKDAVPNVHLRILANHDGNLHQTRVQVDVKEILKIALSGLKKSHQPGARQNLSIRTTTTGGKGVPTELTLSLFNQALHEFTDDTPPELAQLLNDVRRGFSSAASSSIEYNYNSSGTGYSEKMGHQKPYPTEIRTQERAISRAYRSDWLDSAIGALQLAPKEQWESSSQQRQSFAGGAAPDDPFAAAGADDPFAAPGGGGADPFAADPFAPGGGDPFAAPEGGGADPFAAPDMGGFGGDALNENMDEMAQAITQHRPRVKKKTALPMLGKWWSRVTTDANGEASIDIPFPDAVGTWELQSFGCTKGTNFGNTKVETVTKQDLIVAPSMPDTFQAGDLVRIPISVHAPKQIKSVTVQMQVKSATVDITQEKTIEVTRTSTVLMDAFKVPADSNLTVTFSAQAKDLSYSATHESAIRSWGMEHIKHAAGSTSANTDVTLMLPEGLTYNHKRLRLLFSTTPSQAIIDATTFSLPKIHGSSIDDPGSELLATLAGLSSAISTSDLQAAPELRKSIQNQIAGFISSQRNDGGWRSYGQINSSNAEITARIHWGLSACRRTGIEVPASVTNKSRGFLDRRFSQVASTDQRLKCVILHALSIDQSADFAHCNRLYRMRDNLSPAARCYLGAAFANLDRFEPAVALLSNLLYDATPIDAQAVAAMALIRAKKGANAQAIVAGIQKQLGIRICHPHAPRGPALMAMSALYRAFDVTGTEIGLSIIVNGKEALNVPAAEKPQTRIIDLPPSLLVPGANRIQIKKSGSGAYLYGVSLIGFSNEFRDPKSWKSPSIHSQQTFHSQRTYLDRPIGVASTTTLKHLPQGDTAEIRIDVTTKNRDMHDTLIADIYLPAGARLIRDSLNSKFRDFTISGNKLTIVLSPRQLGSGIKFKISGITPGTYRMLPAIIRDLQNPSRFRLGMPASLVILPSGQPSPDPYLLNESEHLALGRAAAAATRAAPPQTDTSRYRADAIRHYAHLFPIPARQTTVAQDLLWLYAELPKPDPRKLIDAFEVVRTSFPQEEIPFARILKIADAYLALGETERAWLVRRAVIDANYLTESAFSATLEDLSRYRLSFALQANLWQQYPDSPDAIASYVALTESFPAKLGTPKTQQSKRPKLPATLAGFIKPNPSRKDILAKTAELQSTFLALYPSSPLADDMAFSMVNTQMDLRTYPKTIELCRLAEKQYPKSKYASAFTYLRALAHYWNHDFDSAVAAAETVANSKSQDRHYAAYVIGQIHDALDHPAKAVDWYGRVKNKYDDAALHLNRYERRVLEIPELVSIRPGEAATLKVAHQNLSAAELLVYKVDLEALFQASSGNSWISDTALAGITPMHRQQMTFVKKTPYARHYEEAQIKIPAAGAYLVIAQSQDASSIGLIVSTPLELAVDELPNRTILARLSDAETGAIVGRAKVWGRSSLSADLQTGETDLRGRWTYGGLVGRGTILARSTNGHFAIARGSIQYAAPGTRTRPRRDFYGNSDTSMLRRKLDNIIIPKISFEDASIKAVVKYLKQRSKDLDPDQTGINLYLQLSPGAGYAPPVNDPFASSGGNDPFANPFAGGRNYNNSAYANDIPITMDFDNIPLGEAIRYICNGAGLKYRIEPHAVIIADQNQPLDPMETRIYPVSPSMLAINGGSRTNEGIGGHEHTDPVAFFSNFGVDFPEGAKISFNTQTSKLIVTNTPENLRKVERLLRELGSSVGSNEGFGGDEFGGEQAQPSFQSNLDYRGNINAQKSSMQQDAFKSWNNKRRNNSKSVQAKDAY